MVSRKQRCLISVAYYLGLSVTISSSFVPKLSPRAIKVMEATKASAESETLPSTHPYADVQLQEALNSLLEGSECPDYDARHIFGYGNMDHKLSILQVITATRVLDYRAKQSDPTAPSEEELMAQAKEFSKNHGPILNLQKVIQSQSPRMALAAEFKRASPSKGDIALGVNAGEQAQRYASAGANIISVLTESHWFRGSLSDMTDARLRSEKERPAILRKDFVISKYMIAEAAAAGADTILLIVAILPQHLLKNLIDYSRSIGMEPLVEVHAEEELGVALEAGARVIGVNNRNLHTFQVDMSTSQVAASRLSDRGLRFHHEDASAEYTLCALSGMSTALDVDRYRQSGLGMCLIGESLMRAADPVTAIKSLCLHPDDFQSSTALQGGGAYTAGTKIVKVCGVTNAQDALVACRAGANLIGVIFAQKSKRRVTEDQAKEVVNAVRGFGERNSRSNLSLSQKDSPLFQLVANAQSIEAVASRPLVVGVFQNQDPEFVREMVQTCGLDLVQLHGSEGMQAANEDLCGVPAIRVVDIETDPGTGKAAEGAVEKLLESLTVDPVAILLDTSIKGAVEGGGTGVVFDWSLAEKVQSMGLPVIIAGGLTVDNIKDAVGNIRPWGVDVSSGVEVQPGVKNHDKVKAFVQNARSAAQEASKGF